VPSHLCTNRGGKSVPVEAANLYWVPIEAANKLKTHPFFANLWYLMLFHLFVDESSVTPAVSRLGETPQRSLSRFQGRSRLPAARLLASPSKTLKMDLISLGRGRPSYCIHLPIQDIGLHLNLGLLCGI
jgi:hypothetical protein